MTRTELALKEFCLVLDRKDLGEMYPRLDTEDDWHRLSQRLYVINRDLARPAGVQLVLQRDKESIRVYFSSREEIQKFVSRLQASRGFIQQAMAGCIQHKSNQVVDKRSIPGKLLESQIGLLREILSRDLGIFAGIDLDSIWVDVELSKGVSVFSKMAGALPGSVLITGVAGSGKTSLLHHLLSQWKKLGSKHDGLTPVYISAMHLHFEWGRFSIPWETLPGIEPFMAKRLETAFSEGRLILLIDGVNENPECTDFSNPAVPAFWRTAAKNTCVMTLLPAYYDSHLKLSPLEAFFNGRLRRIQVPSWGVAEYRALFENISREAGRLSNASVSTLAAYLNKLSADEWQKESNLLRFTPLTGLACANFFASNQGLRLPKNEYELMEHMTAYYLRHEGFKGTSPLFLDTVLEFLMKLAWRAYVDGLAGQWYCIPFRTSVQIFKEHYPILENRRSEILALIGQLPYLEYSPANGSVFMNQHFADYLCARQVLHSFLAGDYTRLREMMLVPWQYYNLSRSYFQGIQCLDAKQKRQFFQTNKNMFQLVWQEYLKGKKFIQEVALVYVLQPLGFLDIPEARDHLWNVYGMAEGRSEMVLMSCAISLAWWGDESCMERYVQRLRTNPAAARFNLNFYLFYRRQDRVRFDLENFTPELIGNWDAVADWFLDCIMRKAGDFYPLRLLYAFTLWNFLKTMGPSPFAHPDREGVETGDTRRRREALSKIIVELDGDPRMKTGSLFRQQVSELKKILMRQKLIGGQVNGRKEEVPSKRAKAKETVLA